jgi:hypothetical protein
MRYGLWVLLQCALMSRGAWAQSGSNPVESKPVAESPCEEEPCPVTPSVLIDEAQETTQGMYGFRVADFYPLGFSRQGAFAYVVSGTSGAALNESGWFLEVMDAKTDKVIEALCRPRARPMSVASALARAGHCIGRFDFP